MSVHIAVRKLAITKFEDSDMWTACGVRMDEKSFRVKYAMMDVGIL